MAYVSKLFTCEKEIRQILELRQVYTRSRDNALVTRSLYQTERSEAG